VERRSVAEAPLRSSDLVVRLTDGLALRATSAPHDAFFGRDAEGYKFDRFLPVQDSERFSELMANVAATRRPHRSVVAIATAQGFVEAELTAGIDVARAEGGATRYVVGLRVLGALPDAGESFEDSPPVPSEHGRNLVADAVARVNLRDTVGRRHPPEPWDPAAMQDQKSSTELLNGDGAHRDAAPHPHRRRPLLPFLQRGGPERAASGLEQSPGHSSLGLSSNTEVSELEEVFERARSAASQAASPTGRVDAAVNTTIVMDGMSFRCTLCSKPPRTPRLYDPEAIAPVMPGRMAQALIAKLDRKKGLKPTSPVSDRSRRDGDARLYRGPDFNGCWAVSTEEGARLASDWLRSFEIRNGLVHLGDGTEAKLVQLGGPHGPVLLRGGSLRRRADGCLVRAGKSGVDFEFVECAPGPGVTPMALAAAASIPSSPSGGASCISERSRSCSSLRSGPLDGA